jgi:anti-sigma regulatory factor (Ser/Thr protein kinase)
LRVDACGARACHRARSTLPHVLPERKSGDIPRVTRPAPDHQRPAADRVRIEVADDVRAVGQARSAARDALLRWHLPALLDTVVLVASELVTNALRYGKAPVYLILGLTKSHQVEVNVHDANPAEPTATRSPVHPDKESGRGLDIVDALADEVTVEQVPDDGKIVRATFSVSPEQ